MAAATWDLPHLLLADEVSNYLDRSSLSSLTSALKNFGGGVILITHHGEFAKAICSETWTVGGGKLVVTGQSAALLAAEKLEWKRQEEMTDAFGNTIKVSDAR